MIEKKEVSKKSFQSFLPKELDCDDTGKFYFDFCDINAIAINYANLLKSQTRMKKL